MKRYGFTSLATSMRASHVILVLRAMIQRRDQNRARQEAASNAEPTP